MSKKKNIHNTHTHMSEERTHTWWKSVCRGAENNRIAHNIYNIIRANVCIVFDCIRMCEWCICESEWVCVYAEYIGKLCVYSCVPATKHQCILPLRLYIGIYIHILYYKAGRPTTLFGHPKPSKKYCRNLFDSVLDYKKWAFGQVAHSESLLFL